MLTPTEGPSLAEVLYERLTPTSTKKPVVTDSVEQTEATATFTPSSTATTMVTEKTKTPKPVTTQLSIVTYSDQSPHQTPSPTIVLTKAATLRVLLHSINVREGPGTRYEILGFITRDDEVSVLARNRDGSWFNVITGGDISGWVAGSVTEFTNNDIDLNSVEIAVTIPIPPTLTPTATPTLTPTPTELPSPPPSNGGSSGGGSKPDKPYPAPTNESPATPDNPPEPTENPYP